MTINLTELLAAQADGFADRFWARVAVPSDECWPWLGARRKTGYGQMSVSGRCIMAHRVAYVLTFGPFDYGLTIDHLCGNKGCVNPAHLEPVSSAENSLRGGNPLAVNARKSHCIRGHELTGDNLGAHRLGRRCKQCARDYATERIPCPICGETKIRKYVKGHAKRVHGVDLSRQEVA